MPELAIDFPPFLQDLPPQFEPLRSHLEANLLSYIKIRVGEPVGGFSGSEATGDPLPVWRSKIGGNPYFPQDEEYPIDPDTGKAMPLLLQINCAEVPPIPGFDFPSQGILQFYLGYEPIDADNNPEKYRVLYFPEVHPDDSQLITDFSFIEDCLTIRELYDAVYPIEFVRSGDLFWETRQTKAIAIPNDLVDLYDDFYQWVMNDSDGQGARQRGSKLGGYVDLHADVDEIAERATGRLLLELRHPSHSDDHFYFFIPDLHLRERSFRNVEFHFVCD